MSGIKLLRFGAPYVREKLIPAAQLVPFADPRRAECVLVVDCGQSYTHAVPVVRDEVQWHAVRRLDIGGKMLTNLLKVSFSYKQWNMMDETYLTDKMKAISCFVAASANDTNPRSASDPPHTWSFARFVDHFHEDEENDLVQHYVLPDYAQPEDVADPKTKFGYVMTGPGNISQTQPLPDREEEALDAFVAGTNKQDASPKATEHQVLRLAQERYQLMELLFAPQRIGTYVRNSRRARTRLVIRVGGCRHPQCPGRIPKPDVGKRRTSGRNSWNQGTSTPTVCGTTYAVPMSSVRWHPSTCR